MATVGPLAEASVIAVCGDDSNCYRGALHALANCLIEWPLPVLPEGPAGLSQGSASGHEDAFPPPKLSGRCRFSQETFVGTRVNARDAPLADIDVTTISRPRATKPDINGSAYSITLSARARINGGIVRPSALAVLRLMMSLNVVGCSIGRSAG